MSLATVDVSSLSGSPGPLEQLSSVNPELRSECMLVFYNFYTNQHGPSTSRQGRHPHFTVAAHMCGCLQLSSSSTVNTVRGGNQHPGAFNSSLFAQGCLLCCFSSQQFYLLGISISAKPHEVRQFWRLQISSCDQWTWSGKIRNSRINGNLCRV